MPVMDWVLTDESNEYHHYIYYQSKNPHKKPVLSQYPVCIVYFFHQKTPSNIFEGCF